MITNVRQVMPTEDRVLVERTAGEERHGSIIIPDAAQEKPMYGTMIATGPGKRNDKGDIVPLTVKVGDSVIFAKWGGTEIKIGDKEYLIMKESDILAVIKHS